MSNVVSILIPARNETYLQRTIYDLLENAHEEIEILAICDGYWPDPPIQDHPAVNLIHHSEARGQRQGINLAAKIARGKFIMKLDGHCAVAPGFDVELKKSCEYEWTMIPRMYNLDVETWKPKLHKRTDYMYIGGSGDRLLRAEYYKKQPDNEKPIDEIMCCMGPCFFMHKDRFWELGGMDESHGSWGQMGVELACKAWLSGGALVVNKNTWFAHWFRGGGGPGFPYPITFSEQEAARNYSRSLWLQDAWKLQKRPFKWLVEKFQPPGWEEQQNEAKSGKMEEKNLYQFIHRQVQVKPPRWRGHKTIKYPNDLLTYHKVIWEKKPDVIIETGTAYGGSAVFFGDMLNLLGKGKVISIDKEPQATPEHERVTYIIGRSTAVDTLERLKTEIPEGASVMVILDSDHRSRHVKRELVRYAPLVSKGQFLVVEDIHRKEDEAIHPGGPGEAVNWFLETSIGKQFQRTPIERDFYFAVTQDGWLLRE